MEQVELPKFIDKPPTVLLWSVDEILPIAISVIVGMQMNHALICTIVGFCCMHFYKRYLDQNPDGFVSHLLYAYGFYFTKSRAVPNPFEKEFW